MIGAITVDEDIGDFQDVLDSDDRKFTLAEEINSRLFGVQTMLKHSFDSLMNSKEDKKHPQKLTGIHTYDILRNKTYAQLFQYFGADLPDRDDYIIDDDDDESNNNA